MQIALVHDWLNQMGGAEAVLEEMVTMYSGAPIFTSIYARGRMPDAYQSWDIRPLWTDNLPGIRAFHQPYLLFYPPAFAALDLSEYDVILSNKSGFCHGIKAGSALHICYCLSPTRYVWQSAEYMERERFGGAMAAILQPFLKSLQQWDFNAAQRVNHFVAISSEIQRRIEHYYKRDSVIIYPPVDTGRYQPASKQEDYFLVVSRLIPYKRIDLAVKACTKLGLPLKVAGSGRDQDRLKSMAGPTVEFLGHVPDADLPDLMARCRGFIFPGLEDFGIAPVEAQAAGRPVIAFRGGGALDTVIEGTSGVFFDDPTADSLCWALQRFSEMTFNTSVVRANAERFDSGVFRWKLAEFISKRYDERQQERKAAKPVKRK